VDKSREEGLGNVSREGASTRFVRWRACIEVRGGHLEMKACSVGSVCGVGILAGDPGPKQSESPQEGANESQDDSTVKNVKTIHFRNQGSQEGAIQSELRDENTHVETTPFRHRGASGNPGAEGGPEGRVEGGAEGGVEGGVLEPADRALGGCGVGEGSVEGGGEEGPLFLELRHVNWGQARVKLSSCSVSNCGDVGILIGLHASALLLHVCCERNGDAGILIRASGPLVNGGACREGVHRDYPTNSSEASVSAMHCNVNGNMRQGVAVEGACARVTLRNSSLSQNSMQGLAVVEGGCGEVTACKLSRNGWANLAAFDGGTHVTVCLSEMLEGLRSGATAQDGARLEMDQCLVASNACAGILALAQGSLVVARRCLLRGNVMHSVLALQGAQVQLNATSSDFIPLLVPASLEVSHRVVESTKQREGGQEGVWEKEQEGKGEGVGGGGDAIDHEREKETERERERARARARAREREALKEDWGCYPYGYHEEAIRALAGKYFSNVLYIVTLYRK
jgi:hypothetical protein